MHYLNVATLVTTFALFNAFSQAQPIKPNPDLGVLANVGLAKKITLRSFVKARVKKSFT